MELNQQLSGLQDEFKLLKGEIKNVLKEIRGAVLSEDNPFTKGANTPTFRAVGRSDAAAAEGPDEPEGEEVSPSDEGSEEPDAALAGGPTTPPPGALAGPSNEPTLLHAAQGDAPSEDAGEASEKPDWNMLTIASLAAWSEDALKSLGPRRFQTVLELACFANLLTSDVKDVLSNMAEIAPEEASDEKPMHINDCLVVLHQLEAILQGDKIRRLPMRRRRRSRIR